MNNKLINWILFIVLCIIWGSTFKLMKDSTAGLNAMQIAGLRIFSAGIVFIPFAVFHFSKIPKEKLGLVILSGVMGNLLPAFLFAIAMTKIDGALGGILNALTPIWVVVVGILFFQLKTQSQKIIGVVTGFVGLVLLMLVPVFYGQKTIDYTNLGYTSLILLATLFYGFNVNMVGKNLKTVKPLHLATVSIAFMTIPTLLILFQQRFFQLDFTSANTQYAIWASTALGIVGSAIATAIFYILVKRAGGLFASLVTYGIPFIALFWGFLDNEKIIWLQIICLGIILVGVWLANKPGEGTRNTGQETSKTHKPRLR